MLKYTVNWINCFFTTYLLGQGGEVNFCDLDQLRN